MEPAHIRTTMDDVIRFVSPSARAVLGCAPEEMVARPASDFAHPDDLVAGERQLEAPPDAPVTHVQRVRRKDGEFVWMESVVRLLRGADGSLVAGVAHEVRTPLTYLSTDLALVERAAQRLLDASEGASRDRAPTSWRA